MEGANSTYWGNIRESFSSLRLGLVISWRHLKLALQGKKRKPLAVEDKNYFEQQDGLFTIQYPSEAMPVPDNGRYRLHNEMEDCIVCDKCAKICPVNCIDIEPIRSGEEIRKASDGTSVRMYAAKFDIDMAKCCFCGLCTTVCPTECLTMTKSYDFSEFDVGNLTYNFTDLTPKEAEQKKEEFDIFQAAKKQKQAERGSTGERPAAARPKGVAPKIKPTTTETSSEEKKTPSKPTMKPKISGSGTSKPKPVIKKPSTSESEGTTPKPKPVIKPKIPSVKKETENTGEEAKKPSLKPVIKKTGGALKPKIPSTPKTEEAEDTAKKSPLKPKIPGASKPKEEEKGEESTSETKKQALKPVIKKPAGSTGGALKPKIPTAKKPEGSEDASKKSPLKPKIPGTVKPKTEATEEGASSEAKKPALKPKIPGVKKPEEENKAEDKTPEKKAALKPKIPSAKKPNALKPKIKPKTDDTDDKE